MLQFFCLSCSIVPASVTTISKSIIVKEGQNVTLVCHGFGLPAPIITWSDGRNEVMENGHIWQLPKISRNVAGQYSCTASNACGNDNRKVDIDVQCESISPFGTLLPGAHAVGQYGIALVISLPIAFIKNKLSMYDEIEEEFLM